MAVSPGYLPVIKAYSIEQCIHSCLELLGLFTHNHLVGQVYLFPLNKPTGLWD